MKKAVDLCFSGNSFRGAHACWHSRLVPPTQCRILEEFLGQSSEEEAEMPFGRLSINKGLSKCREIRRYCEHSVWRP